ncbi:MAG: hypothetical protein Q9220_007316 [cf. Caloplaca sp. 1 TL-2023]
MSASRSSRVADSTKPCLQILIKNNASAFSARRLHIEDSAPWNNEGFAISQFSLEDEEGVLDIDLDPSNGTVHAVSNLDLLSLFFHRFLSQILDEFSTANPCDAMLRLLSRPLPPAQVVTHAIQRSTMQEIDRARFRVWSCEAAGACLKEERETGALACPIGSGSSPIDERCAKREFLKRHECTCPKAAAEAYDF